MTDAEPIPGAAGALLTRLASLAGEAEAGTDLAADARFRAVMRALGEDRAALLAPLTAAQQAAFRAALGRALAPLGERLRAHREALIRLADSPDDAQWYPLCAGRSALQFLIDDYASTPLASALADAPLARLDTLLRAMGARQGPVDAEDVPDAMPASHWWWWHPAAEAEAEADATPDEEADTTAATAADPQAAQAHALNLAQALRAVVEPLLRALHGADGASLLAAIQPRAEDYAQVFEAALAAPAQVAYERLWAQQPPSLRIAGASSRLEIHICPAGLLEADNALSWEFPGGLRRLAPRLLPGRVWVAWKLIESAASSGIAYDGLVWIDDHWAWFPKAFRVLADRPPPTPPG